jgi:hypothetical protein
LAGSIPKCTPGPGTPCRRRPWPAPPGIPGYPQRAGELRGALAYSRESFRLESRCNTSSGAPRPVGFMAVGLDHAATPPSRAVPRRQTSSPIRFGQSRESLSALRQVELPSGEVLGKAQIPSRGADAEEGVRPAVEVRRVVPPPGGRERGSGGVVRDHRKCLFEKSAGRSRRPGWRRGLGVSSQMNFDSTSQ